MSVTAAPTTSRTRDYTVAARELFADMQKDPELRPLFEEYRIPGGFICAAGYDGRQEFLIQFGEVDPFCAPQENLKLAIEAAMRVRALGGLTSRETRLAEVDRLAGAVCGFQRIISCRLMAHGPLSTHDRIELEDMSELFVLALGLRLRQKYQINEMNRELVHACIARYESHLLDRFRAYVF